MRAITYHLTSTDSPDNSRAIEQGANYASITFLVPANLSTWTVKGQVRDLYREDPESKVKADFSFEKLEYKEYEVNGTKGMYTAVKPLLTHEQTNALDWIATGMRTRLNAKQTAVPGLNVWVYDIELFTPEGRIEKLARGYVEVIPEVTVVSAGGTTNGSNGGVGGYVSNITDLRYEILELEPPGIVEQEFDLSLETRTILSLDFLDLGLKRINSLTATLNTATYKSIKIKSDVPISQKQKIFLLGSAKEL